MSYATNQFFEFILYRLVENLILRKNQEKKSLGSFAVFGIFGFCREPCFGKKYFFVFLRILLRDFSEKSFFTKNFLINEEIKQMNQNFFG